MISTFLPVFLIAVQSFATARESFIQAVRTGNDPEVKRQLGAGADPNQPVDQGDTALLIAAELGNAEIVAVLLEHGAKVNFKGKDDDTALVRAVKNGRASVAAMLLDAGADFGMGGRFGLPPLLVATDRNDFGLVTLLLDRGADIDAADDYGCNALMHAARRSRVEMIRYLLERGAAKGLADRWGFTPEKLATYCGDARLAALFRGESKPPGTTPVFRAIGAGDEAELTRLIATGSDVNARDSFGRTPLFLASSLGFSSMVSVLAEHGTDVNRPTETGLMPLMAAAFYGRTGIASQLLDLGAVPDYIHIKGFTALSIALVKHDEGLVNLLVNRGATVLMADENGTAVRSEFDTAAVYEVEQGLREKGLKFFHNDLLFRFVEPDPNSHLPTVGETGVTPPKITQQFPPKNPEAPYTKPGYVLLSAILGKDGKTREIRVLNTTFGWHDGFEYNTIEAIKKFKYRPGLLHGEPADVRMSFKLDFEVF